MFCNCTLKRKTIWEKQKHLFFLHMWKYLSQLFLWEVSKNIGPNLRGPYIYGTGTCAPPSAAIAARSKQTPSQMESVLRITKGFPFPDTQNFMLLMFLTSGWKDRHTSFGIGKRLRLRVEPSHFDISHIDKTQRKIPVWKKNPRKWYCYNFSYCHIVQ
jgi:hypothetical protein